MSPTQCPPPTSVPRPLTCSVSTPQTCWRREATSSFSGWHVWSCWASSSPGACPSPRYHRGPPRCPHESPLSPWAPHESFVSQTSLNFFPLMCLVHSLDFFWFLVASQSSPVSLCVSPGGPQCPQWSLLLFLLDVMFLFKVSWGPLSPFGAPLCHQVSLFPFLWVSCSFSGLPILFWSSLVFPVSPKTLTPTLQGV